MFISFFSLLLRDVFDTQTSVYFDTYSRSTHEITYWQITKTQYKYSMHTDGMNRQYEKQMTDGQKFIKSVFNMKHV